MTSKSEIDPWYEKRMWKGKCTCGYEEKPRISYGMICPKCRKAWFPYYPEEFIRALKEAKIRKTK